MSVFDTSAVLAIIYEEDGQANAKARLSDSVISTVNVAEVAGDLIASGRGPGEAAVRFIDRLGLLIVAPTPEQAVRAGQLKRIRGLSLGDCFCIALGEARDERLVTGDQQWAREPAIRTCVELIR